LAHYNQSNQKQSRVHHVGQPKQDRDGIGIADVNGDGKADILAPHGWFEQIDANADKWKW
jgi:hypothetical protein